jgi:hypothetical protein
MPRRWWIALLLSWGLSLGILAAFGVAVILLGIGWVFLFGDDPWPAEFTRVLVPLSAALGGAAAFFGVFVAATHVRRAHPRIEQRLQASGLLRWGTLSAPVLLVAVLFWSIISEHAGPARTELEPIEEAQAGRHRLTDSVWRLDRETGQLRIDMTAAGAAEGSYSLLWEAKAPGLAKPLGMGSVREMLPAGAVHLVLTLDAASLARGYAAAVLSRSETVQIDLTLGVELSLVPVGRAGHDVHLRLNVPLTFSYRPGGAIEFYSAQL